MIRKMLPLLLVTTVTAFAQSAPDKQSYAELVNANTRFAFKLFHQSVLKDPDANVLMSPTALSLDFALLQNGADPAAHDQIASVFDFGNLPVSTINEQSLALKRALIYDPPKEPPKPRARHGIRPPEVCCAPPPEHLTLAGSLWTQPGVAFRRGFLDTNKRFYRFETISVPDRGPASIKAVNDWVARQTGGASSDALDSWQRDDFLLVDATWFKGAWFNPFPYNRTHPGDFKLSSGQKKQMPMMAQNGLYSYLRGTNFQLVRLPYYHAAMYIFLPDEDSSLKDFEQSLTSDSFAAWMHDLSNREGYLELPRFQSDFRTDLTGSLSNMGMDLPFNTFSSFAPLVPNPEGARLSRVLQVISLKVDEKGTEVVSAGIVGGVPGGVSSGPRPEPFRMIVDHPFFFVICDNQSHAILYMGAINDPTPILQAP